MINRQVNRQALIYGAGSIKCRARKGKDERGSVGQSTRRRQCTRSSVQAWLLWRSIDTITTYNHTASQPPLILSFCEIVRIASIGVWRIAILVTTPDSDSLQLFVRSNNYEDSALTARPLRVTACKSLGRKVSKTERILEETSWRLLRMFTAL